MSRKLTQEEAIKRLYAVHKDNIDFSNYLYSNCGGKSVCLCNKHNIPFTWHGRFDHLLNGVGCPECAPNKKLTKNQVIYNLTAKHPDIIFSDFDYINNKTKISCTCKKCQYKWKSCYAVLIDCIGCIKCQIQKSNLQRSPLDNIKKDRPEIDFSNFKYINKKTKGICLCLKCKKEWEVSSEKLLYGQGCPNCIKNKKLTHEEALKKLIINHPKINFEKFVYVNSTTKGICVCKKCGYEWMASGFTHTKNKNCPKCHGNMKKSADEAIDFLVKNFSDIDFSEFVYKNSFTKSNCRCKICGNKWKISYYTIKSNKSGCPKCKQSYYEKKTVELLEKYNINYETQKQFDSCVYKRRLRFDFYLIDHDILIEYDGEQHFKEVNYSDLSLIQLRDSIKDKWCIKNHMNLLRISDNSLRTKNHLSLIEFEFVLKEITSVTRASEKLSWVVL